jgi:beta-mannosidase
VHRRAKPYCMGTMYWQLDDCWPGVTWSGIDYYGRWKAMQYFVKEAYKDILVSVHEENDSVKVYVVNDRIDDVKGSLEFQLEDFWGLNLFDNIRTFNLSIMIDKVDVPSNSSVMVYKISKKELVGSHSLKDMFFSVKLIDNSGKEYKNIYYFVPPKDLALEDPQISYDVDKKTGELVLTCEKLAKNVHIEINDPFAPLNLENNYFDMLPGETVKISTGIKDLDKSNVKVTNLFDAY